MNVHEMIRQIYVALFDMHIHYNNMLNNSIVFIIIYFFIPLSIMLFIFLLLYFIILWDIWSHKIIKFNKNIKNVTWCIAQ